MGEAMLDFFAENEDYDLIVAPHVVFFMRSRRHGAGTPKGYDNRLNILIDVGDVSRRPCSCLGASVRRPCGFSAADGGDAAGERSNGPWLPTVVGALVVVSQFSKGGARV
jgi:hypothetical protein